MLYTGTDQHRDRSTLATFTATGERVAEVTFVNDRAVLTRYFAELPGPHQAVVEATGRWYWLRELLAPQGIDRHPMPRSRPMPSMPPCWGSCCGPGSSPRRI